MKHTKIATVKENIQAAKDTYKLVIKSDIKKILAGQFVSVLCPNLTLRRPFSVCGFNDGEITVLYKVKGEGTKFLQSLKTGNSVDIIGPLGNSFSFEGKKSALLIGAGVGVAPMLFLKKELKQAGIKNYLMTGYKDDSEVISGSDRDVIGGSVLDYAEDAIKEHKPDVIYSCGPEIVLKLVSKLGKKHNIETQVAMERVMACGIGVCRGCIIKTIKNNEIENKSVCKDGPVFKGDEVLWQ